MLTTITPSTRKRLHTTSRATAARQDAQASLFDWADQRQRPYQAPPYRLAPNDQRRPKESRRREQGRRNDQWGRAAEEAAARWYRERGGEIVARRHRTAAGEIDLAVRIGSLLAIVEVKARRCAAAALEAVSAREWRRLSLKAEICAAEQGDCDVRIDLAAVGRDGVIEVIENAGMDVAFS